MAEKVDVLICGGGSAGLCAGVWLARCGIKNFKILERRSGPLDMGQADGVQCRTVELFESFGLSEALLKEAYHVLELSFWSSSDGRDSHDNEDNREVGGIRHTHYAADTEAGLSHQPHVILNQARLNALMTEEMQRASGETHMEYGYEVQSVSVDSEATRDVEAHCVDVTTLKDGISRRFQAKYVLGSDGAHSLVRKALGFKMVGDSSNSVWGVMDVYPRTDFPDVRKKAIINSEAGDLIIIPREGDALARFYMELPPGMIAKDVTLQELHERARLIFQPYTMEIAHTAWWSAYAIGQRLADFFHKDQRVFLGGDACHTHSPKAGQGMNVSLQDGYNLGWKLAAVLRKQAAPELLETYVFERQKTAADLIEFDRYWTKLFSSSFRQENGITQEQFHEQFIKAGRYTAGQATRYEDSIITSSTSSEQVLASRLTVGMRFPSAQVVRLCDARHMHLIRSLPSDSRWHIIVFAGDIRDAETSSRLFKLSHELGITINRFTPLNSDPDSTINPLLVLASKRVEIEQKDIPDVFTPMTGKWRMKCLFKVFVDDEGYNNSGHGHAYESYGVDPRRGAMVIVRPDQYIARIGSLEDVEGLRAFFDGFMRKSHKV